MPAPKPFQLQRHHNWHLPDTIMTYNYQVYPRQTFTLLEQYRKPEKGKKHLPVINIIQRKLFL